MRRVLIVTLLINLGVAAAKFVWGTLGGSVAMVADGFHSLFDGTSNIVGLVALRLAALPPDSDHPYGHGKYETYASAGIGALLAFAAYNIGSTAIDRLFTGGVAPRVDDSMLIVMVVTLVLNIAVAYYERVMGRRLRSDLLLADARHTVSDVFVSVGVIIGLVAVSAGYPAADPLMALIVAIAIAWAAWGVLAQASVTLSDTARIPASELATAVSAVEGVRGSHSIRTRGSHAEVYVDLHVQVDPSLTVEQAHRIAQRVEHSVHEAFSAVVDVVVHVEPDDEHQAEKTRAEADVVRG